MSIFKTKNLSKNFNRRMVVKGIDIEVRSGEIIALLGRNGAGKTTSFLMMAGLLKPDTGTIYLDDTDISKFSSSQRAETGITYLPQENSVFLKTSTENNLKMIIELKHRSRKERDKISNNLLEEMGLLPLAKQSAQL